MARDLIGSGSKLGSGSKRQAWLWGMRKLDVYRGRHRVSWLGFPLLRKSEGPPECERPTPERFPGDTVNIAEGNGFLERWSFEDAMIRPA